MELTKRLAGQLRAFSEYLQLTGAALFQKAFKVHGIKGLSLQQLRYLEIIEGSPGVTPGELTAAFGVRKPTVANMLNNLEQSGLVQRKKDDMDGRVYRLFPTRRTTEVFEMRRGMYLELAAHVRARLTKQEISELTRLMAKIATGKEVSP